jgi:hypothetical protein
MKLFFLRGLAIKFVAKLNVLFFRCIAEGHVSTGYGMTISMYVALCMLTAVILTEACLHL